MKKVLNILEAMFSSPMVNRESEKTISATPVIFTSADLWNIHRQARQRPQRRFL
ncbi:MAG TPA: hypothetical protein PKC39_02865 [Ferruginibacter sp.]|nr:hypothetical protein [Ferruginibacter sp.]HMP19879.1 hypothetical protein [Ferruginibacter sp.]